MLAQSWPIVGSLYLTYLALQAPPVRYVGIGGLVVVTPLLVGWVAGRLFDVGPWADDETGADVDDTVEADGTGGDVETPSER